MAQITILNRYGGFTLALLAAGAIGWATGTRALVVHL